MERDRVSVNQAMRSWTRTPEGRLRLAPPGREVRSLADLHPAARSAAVGRYDHDRDESRKRFMAELEADRKYVRQALADGRHPDAVVHSVEDRHGRWPAHNYSERLVREALRERYQLI